MSTTYDLMVIGGGSAGLTAAGIAASVGVKTLLVEKDRFGGDCTWTGCVPSKTLLAEAEKVYTASKVTGQNPGNFADFSQIIDKIKVVQKNLYKEADSPEALGKFGVNTINGEAQFIDNKTVKISLGDHTKQVTAKYIFIATGAEPITPPIEGLKGVDYLTSDNLFKLEKKPDSLAVIGGGPIGVEMAQAFNRLGTDVDLIESKESILPSDTELSRQLQKILITEGVQVYTSTRAEKVVNVDSKIKIITSSQSVVADKLLVAVGRTANTAKLNLSSAGVETDEDNNVKTNSYGQTSQSNIYAIGDVAAGPRFTHQSEHEAKQAVFRALFKLRLSADKLTPRVTYTDPELAAVGVSRRDLESNNQSYDTYTFPYSKLDRACTDATTEGGILVFTNQGGDSILGAQVLGPRAGELISELGLAIQNNIGLSEISRTVHPYPSYGLSVRRLADQYMVHNQPNWLLQAAQYVFGYRGSIYRPQDDEII